MTHYNESIDCKQHIQLALFVFIKWLYFPFALVDSDTVAAFGNSGYSNTPRPDFRPSLPAFTYCTSSGQGRNFSPRDLCRYSRICRRVSSPTRSTSSNGPMG